MLPPPVPLPAAVGATAANAHISVGWRRRRGCHEGI